MIRIDTYVGRFMKRETRTRVEDDELTTLKRRLEWAQRLVRKHVKPGVSLADELISEGRKAACNE